MRRDFPADDAATAAAVVDHDLHAQHLSELVDDDARDRVVGAAGGIRRYQADRMRRKILRPRAELASSAAAQAMLALSYPPLASASRLSQSSGFQRQPDRLAGGRRALDRDGGFER